MQIQDTIEKLPKAELSRLTHTPVPAVSQKRQEPRISCKVYHRLAFKVATESTSVSYMADGKPMYVIWHIRTTVVHILYSTDSQPPIGLIYVLIGTALKAAHPGGPGSLPCGTPFTERRGGSTPYLRSPAESNMQSRSLPLL